jgi:hypothetical protein
MPHAVQARFDAAEPLAAALDVEAVARAAARLGPRTQQPLSLRVGQGDLDAEGGGDVASQTIAGSGVVPAIGKLAHRKARGLIHDALNGACAGWSKLNTSALTAIVARIVSASHANSC